MVMEIFNGRTCGNCSFNDGMCYTSNPPKFRCTFDNEYYEGFHPCHFDLKPVIHAIWDEGNGRVEIDEYDSYLKPTYICSNCKIEEDYRTDYCPNCGAKMV